MIEKYHHASINKAINYILENITEPPSLDEVSKISGFSKFHFHRLFKTFTGETLNQFIKRIRLEQAAFILLFDKERPITDIALSCGFSNSQNFATSFKKYFSVTPKQYKQNRACQGIAIDDPEVIAKYDISLMYIGDIHLTYERYFGSYDSDEFYAQKKRALTEYPQKQHIIIYWDDPTITAKENHRYDYGYVIEKSENTTNTMQTIEEDIYIVLTLPQDGAEEADHNEVWNYLYSSWLPRHGYIPNKLFCFEIIDTHTIKFHIPIKKV